MQQANRADAQGLSVIPFHLIDTGKRERKKIHSYKEGEGGLGQGGQASGQKLRRQNKLPKHLRLPKMDEWQFFDRKRLNELYELEEAMYLKVCVSLHCC
jgi:SWI/SNF-related matrix-associated actin-dependent regulator of chromatin subfamily A member 5